MRLATAEDLVFVELDHRAVIAELGEKLSQFLGEFLITRRQIVKALEILRGSLLVREHADAHVGALAQELPYDRSIIDFFESAAERSLEARRFAHLRCEFFESRHRRVVDVSDHRLGQPPKSRIVVAELSVSELGRATQKRRPGAATIA